MRMVWHSLSVIASLIVLAAGAELLVRGATSIACRAGVSRFFIGVTVVGFGTSMPELVTSTLAGLRGLDDIAVGNVVGSNTFNIAFILGLTAMTNPIVVRARLLRGELLIVIAVAMVPFIALLTHGILGRPAGALMLVALAAYVRRIYRAGRTGPRDSDAIEPERPRASLGAGSSLALIAGGMGALIFGSRLLIDSASSLGAGLGIPDLAIGLTVVAAGTSTPELFTSLVAALRKEADVAVGNVFGSNIFNILGVLGATSLLEPQVVRPQVLALDTPVMLLASAALLPIMATGGRISRLEGAVLCAGYLAYAAVLVTLAPAWFPRS